jgi:hypothetical protein
MFQEESALFRENVPLVQSVKPNILTSEVEHVIAKIKCDILEPVCAAPL